MTDNFDMNCNEVPDFSGTIEKYIDPNNTGKIIHDEIKTVLTDDIYILLKKLLVGSIDLDEHIINQPILNKKPSNRKEAVEQSVSKKKWDVKLNRLMEISPKKFNSDTSFCQIFDFNDEVIPSSDKSIIPLMETVFDKQIVLGRQRNLINYYNDKTNFITLNSKFWEHLGHLNDTFIECGAIKLLNFNQENKFPIRIVLTENLFEESERGLQITKYDKDYRITTVLSKELCQFLKYTNCSLYQSCEFPNIFFISKSDIVHDDTKFFLISNNSITDRYKLKYLKYKSKYIKLKDSMIKN